MSGCARKTIWTVFLVTQVAALALGFRIGSLPLELGATVGILVCWRGVWREST